jgi:hypothetical protein
LAFPFAGHELSGVDQFLFSALTANAPLLALLAPQPAPSPVGIFEGIAPEGAAFPCILFAMLSSPDISAVGNDARIASRPLYLVRAITSGPSEVTAERIAKQIDVSLLGARGNVATENVGVQGTYREEMIRYTEVDNGVVFRHCGGRYRMFVSALN